MSGNLGRTGASASVETGHTPMLNNTIRPASIAYQQVLVAPMRLMTPLFSAPYGYENVNW
jgi:hypothetical protein